MRVYVYTLNGWITQCNIKRIEWGLAVIALDEKKWSEAGARIAPHTADLPTDFVITHANLKRAVFELRRVLVDGDGALEARVAACLGIAL